MVDTRFPLTHPFGSSVSETTKIQVMNGEIAVALALLDSFASKACKHVKSPCVSIPETVQPEISTWLIASYLPRSNQNCSQS